MSAVNTHTVRVYYEDTDFSGNVYHASYLKFFERGRTEWLRDIGLKHTELSAEGFAFAVRHMEIDFLGPAHIDDLLTVETRFARLSGARVVLQQTISRGDALLTRAEVTVVTITASGRATRMPATLRALFLAG